MFTGAVGSKSDIEGIFNKNIKSCGVKFIEFDGFDADLSNYYYKAGFLVDQKIIQISFPLFPFNGFGEVHELWKNFGLEFSDNGWSCDAQCYEKQTEYMKQVNMENKIVKTVTNTYSQILSTFQFLN